MAYNFNQFGNYASGYGSSIAGPYSPVNASYGQSVSSEAVDYNNLPPMPQYQPAGYSPCANPCANPCSTPSSQQYCQQNTLDTSDPQLQQQVDQIVQSLQQYKRPVLRRQVITVPSSCPGRVACLTRRLPTPAPDIIERITVVKPPRDVVNLTIEKPTQPGPCFQQREICGKSRKPLIQPRVVSVPPRNNGCQQQAPQSQPAQPCTPPPPQPPCVPCTPPPATCTPAPFSYSPYSSAPFPGSPFPQFSPVPPSSGQTPQFSPYSPNFPSFPPSTTPYAGMSGFPNPGYPQY
jgi:hypothetical protein